MRSLRWIVLLVVVTPVAACGSSGSAGTTATPTTPAPTTTAETTPTTPSSHKVGDVVDTGEGLKVTLHGWKLPAPGHGAYDTPPAGSKYGAADVEACAESKAGSINPFDFTLQMADNRRIEHGIGGPEPALHHTELPPGDCARGYVTFDVPDAGTPAYLVFSGGSIVRPVSIKWAVS